MLYQNYFTKTKSLWIKNKNVPRSYTYVSTFSKAGSILQTNNFIDCKYLSFTTAFSKKLLAGAFYLRTFNFTDMLVFYQVYRIFKKSIILGFGNNLGFRHTSLGTTNLLKLL